MANTPKTTYTPQPMTNITTVEELRRYVWQELQKIATQFNETTETYYRPVNRAPDKLRDGLVAFADGTNWNPGGGEGLYQYYAGTWHKL